MQARILLAVAILSAGFAGGWAVHGWYTDSKDLTIRKALEAELQRVTELKRNVEIKYEQQEQDLRAAQQVVTKEIIKYVPSATMSSEWVRVHDCAVRQAPCPPDDTTTDTYTDADALYSVTENYARCRLEINRFKGLQEWLQTN